MVKCTNCGKEIKNEVIRPMEWAEEPFCTWKCVYIYSHKERDGMSQRDGDELRKALDNLV